MTDEVHVFEVGVRDGLQNEPNILPLSTKLWLIRSLIGAGIKDIELGSFVRKDRIPQVADTDQLYSFFKQESKDRDVNAWCLVPNRKGLERALSVGVTHIAVFTAATESFVQRNIGMSVDDSLHEFGLLIQEGRRVLGNKLKVRGYISTAFVCPFEGAVAAKKALKVIEKLRSIGADQISIGDTLGAATPKDVERLIGPAFKMLEADATAVHFHDTRGTALANALRAFEIGVRTIDSSAGGLGGCPFAPGAAGNLATEDLVYMLNGMGVRTGVDFSELCEASLRLAQIMKRPLTSRALQAYAASKVAL